MRLFLPLLFTGNICWVLLCAWAGAGHWGQNATEEQILLNPTGCQPIRWCYGLQVTSFPCGRLLSTYYVQACERPNESDTVPCGLNSPCILMASFGPGPLLAVANPASHRSQALERTRNNPDAPGTDVRTRHPLHTLHLSSASRRHPAF